MQSLGELIGVWPSVYEKVLAAEAGIQKEKEAIDTCAVYNQAKVLNAFARCNVQARHFAASTGYGYSDEGRDTLEALYAAVFDMPYAIVRPQIVSGTHALTLGLRGLLRPGDSLCYVTGRPYDTLASTIGITPAPGSLAEFGIGYSEVELQDDGNVNIEAVCSHLRSDTSIKVIAMQRSSGYSWRRPLTVAEIEAVADAVKQVRSDIYVFVDNCYGEFTETKEPTRNVDVLCGSLIKNPGGGIAPTGGYICLSEAALPLVESALTTPGLGRECGSYEGTYRTYYQGLFMAPSTVANALKTAALFASVFSEAGYPCMPGPHDERHDIIQAICLESPEQLIRFCKAIQAASPVDSMAAPEPAPMPGYENDIIMAAGTFVQGASIELTADGPLRPPYISFLQGGLTFEHGRIACMKALQALL